MNEASRWSRLWVCGLSSVVWLAGWAAYAVPPIVQLPGTAACVTEDGSGGACVNGVALDIPLGVAVSPDGRNVYAAALTSDSIVVFDRNPATGALTQKAGIAACISETGTGGLCAHGVALDGAADVAVSPDGRNVYATAVTSNSVLIYDRSLATGALSFKVDILGCVSDSGTGDQCANGNALSVPWSLAVSPDGRNVYVAAAFSSAVAVFDRDPNGELTQKGGMAGCVSEGGALGCKAGVAMGGVSAVAVSPDGGNVYVFARVDDSLVILDRDIETGELTQKNGTNGCVSETGTSGDCVNGVALDAEADDDSSVAVSADGRNVYVATSGSDAVAVFDRNPLTGVLTQKAGTLACVSLDGTGGACAQGVALNSADSVTASPDGTSVYVASQGGGVAAFDRNVSTGALTQKTGVAACVSDDGSGGDCVDGKALFGAADVIVSPDGRSVYVTSAFSDGVAVFSRDVPSYDIDGDGESDPLTDGLLLVRYLFGFTGSALVTGAVDLVDCTRCTAPLIESYIESLLSP